MPTQKSFNLLHFDISLLIHMAEKFTVIEQLQKAQLMLTTRAMLVCSCVTNSLKPLRVRRQR